MKMSSQIENSSASQTPQTNKCLTRKTCKSHKKSFIEKAKIEFKNLFESPKLKPKSDWIQKAQKYCNERRLWNGKITKPKSVRIPKPPKPVKTVFERKPKEHPSQPLCGICEIRHQRYRYVCLRCHISSACDNRPFCNECSNSRTSQIINRTPEPMSPAEQTNLNPISYHLSRKGKIITKPIMMKKMRIFGEKGKRQRFMYGKSKGHFDNEKMLADKFSESLIRDGPQSNITIPFMDKIKDSVVNHIMSLDCAAGLKKIVIIQLVASVITTVCLVYAVFTQKTTLDRIIASAGLISSIVVTVISAVAASKLNCYTLIEGARETLVTALQSKIEALWNGVNPTVIERDPQFKERIDEFDFETPTTVKPTIEPGDITSTRIECTNTSTVKFTIAPEFDLEAVKNKLRLLEEKDKMSIDGATLLNIIEKFEDTVDLEWEYEDCETSGYKNNCGFASMLGEPKYKVYNVRDTIREEISNNLSEDFLKECEMFDFFMEQVIPSVQTFTPAVEDLQTYKSSHFNIHNELTFAELMFYAKLFGQKIILDTGTHVAAVNVSKKLINVDYEPTNSFKIIKLSNNHYTLTKVFSSKKNNNLMFNIYKITDILRACALDNEKEPFDLTVQALKYIYNSKIDNNKFKNALSSALHSGIKDASPTKIAKLSIKFGVRLIAFAFATVDVATDEKLKDKKFTSKLKTFRESRKVITDTSDDIEACVNEIAYDVFGFYLGDDVDLLNRFNGMYSTICDYKQASNATYLADPSKYYKAQAIIRLAEKEMHDNHLRSRDVSEGLKTLISSLRSEIAGLKSKLGPIGEQLRTTASRQVPIGIHVFGAPAAGKSTYVKDTLIPEFAKQTGLSDETYTINFSENHWYQPYSGQSIGMYDEFIAMRDEDPILTDINKIHSNVGFNMEGAQIEFKTQPCFLKAVFYISNEPWTKLSKKLSDTAAEALWSRFKCIQYVNCKQRQSHGRTAVPRSTVDDIEHYEYRLFTTPPKSEFMNIPTYDHSTKNKHQHYDATLKEFDNTIYTLTDDIKYRLLSHKQLVQFCVEEYNQALKRYETAREAELKRYIEKEFKMYRHQKNSLTLQYL